ncbi:hypothetical protein EVAR_64892_1 [Eumeta japonica]|uniref:Uncharacterized protein n=1 Tax=Eumeta variegata TaxID=151549 RepID=A0A4C1ZR80_EUMVA|nr:hypothetical protein EVAR_64892_1 [Eumeta japonica]
MIFLTQPRIRRRRTSRSGVPCGRAHRRGGSGGGRGRREAQCAPGPARRPPAPDNNHLSKFFADIVYTPHSIRPHAWCIHFFFVS